MQTREALGVAVHVVVEVARVGVEESDLLLDGAHDARVAVPDERHVVIDVEKGAARVVVEVLHPSAHNFQRLLIRNAEIFSEQLAASRKSFRGTRFWPRETFGGNA